MATGGGGGPPQLWDKDNYEQQGLVCTDERFKDLLNRNSVQLCELMTMSSMWPVLRQLHVISMKQEQDIKMNASNWEMVHRLINHINTGPLWWIHSFLRACIISNQSQILNVLEVDHHQYDDTPSMSSHQQVTMTTGIKVICTLWDRDNPEQQGLVCEDDHCSNLLNSQRYELCEVVMMSPMWPVLRQLHVISAKQEEDIKLNATNSEMVHRLIDHINIGHMWRLHSFLRACTASNQPYVLDLLEVDSDLYHDTPPPSPHQPVPASLATEGDSHPIWDKRNESVHEMVEDTRYLELLQASRVMFRRYLHLSQILPYLQQLDVVQDEILTHNTSKSIAIDKLVGHLQTCQVWKFHGLMRACALARQKHVIEKVGLNPYDYTKPDVELSQASLTPQTQINERSGLPPRQQPDTTNQRSEHSSTKQVPCDTSTGILHGVQPVYQAAEAGVDRRTSPPVTPETSHPSLHATPSHSDHDNSLPPDVIRIIADHAEGCVRLLMRRNMYDLGDGPSGKVIHTAKYHIMVDPQHEGDDGNLIEVAEEEILKCLPGETTLRVVQVHGPPGVGKTELAEHIVFDWAKKFLDNLAKSGPMGLDKELFTTMVYLPARNIKNSVDEAIMQRLLCKEEDKEILFQHIKKGNGIAISLDAMDEVRDVASIECINKYLKYQQTSGDGTRILVTTRSDLGQIETKTFDRLLVLHGFTWHQGLDYIKAYFDGETCEKVIQYTNTHQRQLYTIITNPLRLYIFCELISEGELKLEENDNLTILKLFLQLESLLLRREGAKVSEEESQCMYRMCMYGMLHGMSEFSQKLLDDFGIAEGSHVFFIRKEKTSPTGRQVTYAFPHEMLYEYFAARCIETLSHKNKKSVLLVVCSNPSFRNLQKILFEVILQKQEAKQWKLLQILIRAILILQHEDSQHNEGNVKAGFFHRRSLYKKLVGLKQEVQSPEELAETLFRGGKFKKMNGIRKRINSTFQDDPHKLKELKWFQGLGNGVFGHVAECLQVCPLELKEVLVRSTTGHLLPCQYNNKTGHHLVCSVGKSRWAEVSFNTTSDKITVNAWCKEDAKEALCYARLSTTPSKTVDSLTININKYRNLWGEPPSSIPSPNVQSEYSAELRQWSQICKRIQLVFSVGTSRHALVTICSQSNQIEVYAWSLEDARETLQQSRSSKSISPDLHVFESLTVNVGEYRRLWGKPPTSPGVSEIHNHLGGELQLWSHLYRRHHIEWADDESRPHFVCSVGTDRYGEVVYDPDYYRTIKVHAWCVDDARKVVWMYRMSAAASHHVQGVRRFNLYINQYHSLWGQPSRNTFTPDEWTELSAELAQWSHMCRKDYYYSITLCKTTPLYGLLLSGMRTRAGMVYNGTIDLKDLYSLVHTGQLAHVRKLSTTNIVVPAGSDRAGRWKMMMEELHQTVNTSKGKLLIDPHFGNRRCMDRQGSLRH